MKQVLFDSDVLLDVLAQRQLASVTDEVIRQALQSSIRDINFLRIAHTLRFGANLFLCWQPILERL